MVYAEVKNLRSREYFSFIRTSYQREMIFMSKKKKKAKNIGSKIFAYVMLALAVVSALTSIIAYALA